MCNDEIYSPPTSLKANCQGNVRGGPVTTGSSLGRGRRKEKEGGTLASIPLFDNALGLSEKGGRLLHLVTSPGQVGPVGHAHSSTFWGKSADLFFFHFFTSSSGPLLPPRSDSNGDSPHI